tara:strand:- start:78 stop:686 length:609 start_codon:yes stop_codon:yes gene_type:complete
MNILLLPKITSFYKGQYEYCIDKNWLVFLNETFPKSKVSIPTNNTEIKSLSLIISTGGNDIISHSYKTKDKLRNKIDTKYYNLSKKFHIPFIGVCYGAQLIAEKNNFKISKTKKHTNSHTTNFLMNTKFSNLGKREIRTNSFHNYLINDINNKFEKLAIAADQSVELFSHKERKLLGMMWHPERYKISKNIDKNIFKLFIKN